MQLSVFPSSLSNFTRVYTWFECCYATCCNPHKLLSFAVRNGNIGGSGIVSRAAGIREERSCEGR